MRSHPRALPHSQHELAWNWNTAVGSGSYCGNVTRIPECLLTGPVYLNATSGSPCCDSRLEAQFYPVLRRRGELNTIRAFITLLTFWLSASRLAV